MVATGSQCWRLGTREVAGKGPPPGPPRCRLAGASGGTDLRMPLIRRASKEARNPIQSVSDLCPLERDDDSTLATDLMKKRAFEDGVIGLY